jgi:hypothetical protein
VALVALAALAALAAATPAAAAGYKNGDRVELTGVVTGPDGVPLDGVQVVLEVSRTQFSLRRMQPVTKDTAKLTALTGEGGEYRLEWPWSNYYNTFELVAGVPVRKPGGDRFHELARLDVTRQVERGSPVVTPVVVEDAEFVATLRRFLASIDTDDERRVYRDQGKPDQVKQRLHPDGRMDASWWYFAAGRAYHFRDGRLESTEEFAPVKEF